MSTLTNYNVKVPIDPTSFPATDQSVIWDTSAGAFALGSVGSTGVIAQTSPSTGTVATATTLTFTNGKITANGNEAIIDSLWFTAANYNWGNQTGIASSAGFRLNGSDAYTHVTPRRAANKIVLLSIPSSPETDKPLPFPNNYITFTGLSVIETEDTGSDDEGEGQQVCAAGLFSFNLAGFIDPKTPGHIFFKTLGFPT